MTVRDVIQKITLVDETIKKLAAIKTDETEDDEALDTAAYLLGEYREALCDMGVRA